MLTARVDRFGNHPKCVRSRGANRDRGESGITLMEVLIAMALLGLLLGPLAASMLVMVRGGGTVKETMHRSADAQRIGEAWTHDVQSVAADGVNEPLGKTCGEPAANETELVTFGWDRASDSGGVEKLVTWVARGFGEDVTLLRRYCEGGDIPLNGDGQVLAEEFGVAGMPVSQLVSGGPGAAVGEYCGTDGDGIKRTCTIAINGDFTYSLTVKRRVPDVRSANAMQLPPAPLSVSGIIGHPRWGYLFVDWTPEPQPAGQSAVTDYRVYLYSDAAGTAQVGNPVDVPASASLLRATFNDLTNEVPYFVRIRSLNAVGWSDYSGVYGPMVPTGSIPDRPTTVVATADPGAGTVSVTWDSAANSGGQPRTGYSVWGFLDTTPEVADEVPAGLIGPITHHYTPAELAAQPASTAMTFNLPLENFGRHRFVVADINATGPSWSPGDTVNQPAVSNIAVPFGPDAVLVSASGTDGASCGTQSSPCRSLPVALGNAKTRGATSIGMASGTYGRASVSPANMAAELKIVGGLSADFTSRGSGTTTIRGGSAPSGSGRSDWSGLDIVGTTGPIRLTDLTITGSAGSINAGADKTSSGVDVSAAAGGVVIEGAELDGGAGRDATGLRVGSSSAVVVSESSIHSGDPLGAGESAYGVRALSGSSITIAGTAISAAPGTDGEAGGTGAAGAAGCDGKSGVGGSQSSVAQCSTAIARGGAGGAAGKGDNNGSGGATGYDAAGGQTGGAGGGGGDGKCNGTLGGSHGGNGASGQAGSAVGPPTAPGGAAVSAQLEAWSGNDGATGGAGSRAKGGGGGGGGGGYDTGWWCAFGSDTTGGSGGEGGGGGAGGTGGAGGKAGGGSFGVYANNATLTLAGCTVEVASGGAGGSGGKGGGGGRGGNGGNGGAAGGAYGGGGGAGGGGGGAGSGGAGGEGGPSVGVISIGTASVDVQGSTAIQHAATAAVGGAGAGYGAGGDGGTGGKQNAGGSPAGGGSGGGTKTGVSPAGPSGRLCAVLLTDGTCTA